MSVVCCFARLVREQLCELELPHIYHTVARNSPKRKELENKWQTFQVHPPGADSPCIATSDRHECKADFPCITISDRTSLKSEAFTDLQSVVDLAEVASVCS